MDQNKQQQTTANGSSSDGHIPPPTDPYVTYQTPYPRKPSDEVQNPFIEFRRLADSAFSSFFAGLPKLLGTEQFKESNIRESDQAYERYFTEQAKDFEQRIAEMVRIRAEEAEGFRKQLEQEFEERRRENEKRMEEESQRWAMMRRGLEKCPGLRPEGVDLKRQVESELDLYDGLKAYDAPAYRLTASPEQDVTDRCPWKDDKVDKKCPWSEDTDKRSHRGWLSGLGWDGRRRAKNIPLYITGNSEANRSPKANAEWQEYDDEDMDPFTNDDHVVPWLTLSPYSPLSLIHAWSNDQKDSRGMLDLSEMPVDEAFEDLMSIHKTGKLPNPVGRLVYWGGPDQWMTEMALRGSLGSKWENEGFIASALMSAVDGKQWRGFGGFRGLCDQLVERVKRLEGDNNDEHDSGDWVRLSEDTLQSQSRSALEELEGMAKAFFGGRQAQVLDRTLGARGMAWPTPEEVIAALLEDAADDCNAVQSDHEIAPHHDNSAAARNLWPTPSSENDKLDSIISTLTTTTSRTLPDGSVETKRVLKRRFADGTEESSESVETKPTSSKMYDASTQTTTTPERGSVIHKAGGGWFWS